MPENSTIKSSCDAYLADVDGFHGELVRPPFLELVELAADRPQHDLARLALVADQLDVQVRVGARHVSQLHRHRVRLV